MARCCSAATQAVALSNLHERQPVRAFSHSLVAPHTVVAARVRSQQQSWKLAPRAISQTERDRKVVQLSPYAEMQEQRHREEMQLLGKTPKRQAHKIARRLLIKEGVGADQVDEVAWKLVEAHHDAVASGCKVYDCLSVCEALQECGLQDELAMSVTVDYVTQIVNNGDSGGLLVALRKPRFVPPIRALSSYSPAGVRPVYVGGPGWQRGFWGFWRWD